MCLNANCRSSDIADITPAAKRKRSPPQDVKYGLFTSGPSVQDTLTDSWKRFFFYEADTDKCLVGYEDETIFAYKISSLYKKKQNLKRNRPANREQFRESRASAAAEDMPLTRERSLTAAKQDKRKEKKNSSKTHQCTHVRTGVQTELADSLMIDGAVIELLDRDRFSEIARKCQPRKDRLQQYLWHRIVLLLSIVYIFFSLFSKFKHLVYVDYRIFILFIHTASRFRYRL